MIQIFILIVFINGTAVPTTEFKTEQECESFRKLISAETVDYRAKPICKSWFKTK